MQIQYDQVQAANLAPYLELMQKQQQQPMIDALNRQKLQEGMLNMGSLEYKARKDAQDESDRRKSIELFQAALKPKYAVGGKFYDDQGNPYNETSKGASLRDSLDRSMLTSEAAKLGIDPRVLADTVKGYGDASGMNMEEKQGNVLEALLIKQMLGGNKSESAEMKAQLAQDKLDRFLTKDPTKDAENAVSGVSKDWLGFLGSDDRETAKNTVAKALQDAQDDPERYKQVLNAARASTQSESADALDYALAGLDVAGVAAIPFTGGVSGAAPVAARQLIKAGASKINSKLPALLNTKSGKSIAALLGISALAGQKSRSSHKSIFGDADFNDEEFRQRLLGSIPEAQ